MYPYEPKKHHLLFIHKTHIESLGELTDEARRELDQIVEKVLKEKGITGGTLMIRFGETKYTGASVTHLHAHLFQSDPDHEDYDPKKGVLTRVG
jgi:ATP adenylyltransferase